MSLCGEKAAVLWRAMQISTFVVGVSRIFETMLFESHGLCPVSDRYQSGVRLTTEFTTQLDASGP
jgi:hypothetical protein